MASVLIFMAIFSLSWCHIRAAGAGHVRYADRTVLSRLIRKLHIYAGLLVFAQLLVYGLAGLVATLQPSLERPKSPRLTTYIPFTAPASATDKQVAAVVYRQLGLPMTRPVPDWFLRRTPDNHLLLDFYNINGIYRVIVLEGEHRLRLENIRNNTWLFLEDIHASTTGDGEAPALVRLWAMWNELGMWLLLWFCVSGVWLWLASRPRFVWAWAAVAAGTVFLTALWRLFR